jgi:hypothetical protein
MGRFLVVLLVLAAAHLAAASCPPPQTTRADLFAIKAHDFVPWQGTADDWSIAMLDCLGDPDPALRDGVVFESISYWLRNDALTDPTIRTLAVHLRSQLGDPDPLGFTRPFAALLLAEVARRDRLKAVLSPTARNALVSAAAEYLASVTDYRGFDARAGWRHGVAHGADLVLQLAASPHLTADQTHTLLDAVTVQIAPPGIAYVFGEPDRLARAVFYLHRAGKLPAPVWRDWLAARIDPAPLPAWSAVWSDAAGLARRHDTRAFLLALLFLADLGESEPDATFAGQLRAALEAMMAAGG